MKFIKGKAFKILAISIISLVVLYAIAGFFILPGIVKSKLITAVESQTGRKMSIGDFHINPFALSVTVDNISLTDQEQQKFLGANQLYINIEIISLFNNTLTFSEIRVDNPFIFFKIFKDSSNSFSHLMPESTPAPKKEESSKTLVIDHFTISRGNTTYEDRTRNTPLLVRFDSLSFSLNEFTTRPQQNGLYSFEAETEQGEKFSWEGTITTTPERSSGKFSLTGLKAHRLWEFIQDKFLFEITGGEASMQGTYEFYLQNEKPQFLIHHGTITGNSITIIDKKTRNDAVAVPSARIGGMEFDYLAQKVSIASITVDSATINTLREPDGNYSVKTLMKPIPDGKPSAPWDFLMENLEVKNSTCFLTDQSIDPPANLVISPVNLTMEHYRMDTDEPAKLKIDAGINHNGTIHIGGTMIPLPLETNLGMEISSLGLSSFQPYVDPVAHLNLESGFLSLKGNLLYKVAGKDTLKTFSGSVSIDSFRVTDRVLNEDFLRWHKLALNKIEYKSAPASLKISSIVGTNAYLRAIIDSTRTTNFHHIMVGSDDTTNSRNQSKQTNQSLTQIGEIRFDNSVLNFSDLSLSPNFKISIEDLNGSINDLSSEQLTHAEVDLKGRVDRYAPATIKGQINPLSEELYTDILMQFQNIELTTFTPYSGKFAGYKIDKGKLSLDLHYKLNKKYLQADNKVIVDQLTLGEEVDGPDVTSLPVKLAIALMKDRHGVIDIDLPVEGDLNDPQFSVFPLIMKVLVNIVTKAVTAPFTFIANLFGGGDDLSYIQFYPGTSALRAEGMSKLSNIAKALTDRPELRLDVRGVASDSLDKQGLAMQSIIKQIRTNATIGNLENLTESEQDKALNLYKLTFKTSPDSLLPKLPNTEKGPADPQRKQDILQLVLQKLVAVVPVSNDDLRSLAFQRASEIKNQLVAQEKIEESRIFILDAQVGAEISSDNLIEVPLTLNAK